MVFHVPIDCWAHEGTVCILRQSHSPYVARYYDQVLTLVASVMGAVPVWLTNAPHALCLRTIIGKGAFIVACRAVYGLSRPLVQTQCLGLSNGSDIGMQRLAKVVDLGSWAHSTHLVLVVYLCLMRTNGPFACFGLFIYAESGAA